MSKSQKTRQLREKILNSRAAKSERVTLKELDGIEVEIRGLSFGAAVDLQNSAKDGDGTMDVKRLYPALVIATVFDPETGEQLFDPADRDPLLELPSLALDELGDHCGRVSGILGKADEDIRKNSGTPEATNGTLTDSANASGE